MLKCRIMHTDFNLVNKILLVFCHCFNCLMNLEGKQMYIWVNPNFPFTHTHVSFCTYSMERFLYSTMQAYFAHMKFIKKCDWPRGLKAPLWPGALPYFVCACRSSEALHLSSNIQYQNDKQFNALNINGTLIL